MARRDRAPLAPTCLLLVLAALALAAPTAAGALKATPTFRRALQVYQERAPAVLEAFRGWKAQHVRKYDSDAEERKALQAFEENLRVVQKWAADAATSPELNKFADMPWDEFKRSYLSSMANITYPASWVNATEAASNQQGASRRRQLGSASPKMINGVYLNWADVKKYRTPVRDQGRCGACWAYAAIQALEYAYAIQVDRQSGIPKGYKATQFSIQQVLDCFTTGQGGCGWGSAAAFYNQLNSAQLVTEDYYKLTSSDTGVSNGCNTGNVQAGIGANKDIGYSPASIGYVRLEGAGRDVLKQQLLTSPVVCHFEVDVQFMLYNAKTTPVYTAQTCSGNNLNHALTIVGYDMRTNPPCWIAKNSWGPNWGGLKGYVRIAMTDGTGTCGMYKWCFRPDTNFDGASSVTQADDGLTMGLYNDNSN